MNVYVMLENEIEPAVIGVFANLEAAQESIPDVTWTEDTDIDEMDRADHPGRLRVWWNGLSDYSLQWIEEFELRVGESETNQ